MKPQAGRVARRYARAVFDLARAGDDLEGWLHDLRLLESVLANPQLRLLLENPALRFAQKQEIVDRALPDLAPLRRSFAYVLVAKGRVEVLGAIADELEQLVDEHRGVVHASVVTAVPLDEATAGVVAQRLAALVGKRVILEKRVDPSILGGIVARIGDHLIDGSVATQLSALRQELAR